MRLRRLLTGFLALGAAVVTVAGAAAHAPAARFAGSYAVTFRVTNAHVASTHFVFAPTSRCAGPCSTVSFHQRLSTETTWRATVLRYTLGAKGYGLRRVLPRFANCSAPGGKTVARGFDVVSTQTLRVTRTV